MKAKGVPIAVLRIAQKTLPYILNNAPEIIEKIKQVNKYVNKKSTKRNTKKKQKKQNLKKLKK